MKDIKKLKELILDKIDFAQVLLDYGVDFVFNPAYMDETQLHCPFHGKDVKPSARYYRSTQTIFCWTCHKVWDVISFIKDMENYNYREAILYIINRYHLDTSSIPDDPEFTYDNISISENKKDLITLERKIKELKYKISFERYRALCTAFYMIGFKFFKNNNVSADIKKLTDKLDTIKIG